MFTTINIIKSNKKILGEIAACKFLEGFFILLGTAALVKFIDSPSQKFLLLTLGLFAGRIFIASRADLFFAKLSVNVQTSFRIKIHKQLFEQEIASGELLTLIFDTVRALDEFFLKVAPIVASAIIFLPLFLICAAVVDWLTAIILLVTLPVAPLLLWLIGQATADKNARAWSELRKLNGDFRELLAAITTLKMFNRLDAGATQLKSTSQKSSAATLDVLKLAFVSSFALELITTLSIALVAVSLGLRLVAGNVNFNAALFLLMTAPEFFLPVRKFGAAFHVLISARSALERLKHFLTESEKLSGSVEKILMPPNISVKNLSFAYNNVNIFDDLNLTFRAGKITALIGESGAGKSTLLKLLAGLLKPSAGDIFWNDLPTSRMDKISFLSKIAYAPQAPHLFNSTLFKNFTMFDTLDATHLKKFLAALNMSALNLDAAQIISRGQLQRLGLIRALLKDTPIILLDEPTAGLDDLTEKKVLALLKEISARRTIIIATHRSAVIEFADNVQSVN